MDHTIALVKKAIMEMAKTAEVKLPQFSSFPFLLFGESALRILPSSGAHQMQPPSPIQALGVNNFPSRFINRTVP